MNTSTAGLAVATVPVTDGQRVEVTALFPGNKTFAQSEGSTFLELTPAPEAGRRRPGGVTTPYPNPLYVLLLGLIVGGVWATYGAVGYTLIRIKRASTPRPVARAPEAAC